MNKAQVIGNLGKDPEVRTMQNGDRVCTLKIATSESWRDKATGERKEATEWHSVVIYNGKLIEVAEKYLRKGSKVYAEGQIKTRKWQDQEGKDRYTTEIVIGRLQGGIELIDRPPAAAQPQAEPDHAAPPPSDYAGEEEAPF